MQVEAGHFGQKLLASEAGGEELEHVSHADAANAGLAAAPRGLVVMRERRNSIRLSYTIRLSYN